MTKYLKLLSILFISLSIFLRFFHINNANVFNDELDVGYQAYSILKTGKDYKGNYLPTYIQSFEESRAPLTIYLTVPFVYLFGLNHFSIKLLPIIFSLITGVYFYKLIYIESKNTNFALISAAFLLITPYFFHYSRHAFEISVLLGLLIASVYHFEKYYQSFHKKHLYLSLIFFCLTFYTYNTSNIFTPLLILFLIFTSFKQLKSKLNPRSLLFISVLFIILLSPLIYQTLFGSASHRFGLISIFTDQSSFKEIIDRRTLYKNSIPILDKILYNRPVYYLRDFFKNYFKSLSFSTLFFEADPNPRHSPPGFGFFPSIYIVFLLINLFKTKNEKNRLRSIMLFWLLISPVASSLTQQGGNHATRLALLIIPIVYFVSQGFYRYSNHIFIIPFICFLFFQLLRFYYYYFTAYPIEQYQSWQNNFSETFSDLPKNYNNLYISDLNFNTLKPFLFYQKINPLLVQNQFNNTQTQLAFNLSGYSLGNIFFINNWYNKTLDVVNQISQSQDIFVLFQNKDIPGDYDLSKNPPQDFSTLKVIRNPDGSLYSQIIQKNEK